jgi:transposase
MPGYNSILNLPDYEVVDFCHIDPIVFRVKFSGLISCPFCHSRDLRTKDSFTRRIRHESIGSRKTILLLEAHKFRCRDCGRYFNQRFPGILKYKRSTEGFRREVFEKHHQGICQNTLSGSLNIGSATVERWYHDFLRRYLAETKNNPCPKVLGIDEHFFSRKDGYATTICDLKKHRIFDVVLGRSELSLKGYFQQLRNRDSVQVVLMDLADPYRSLVRKHFPNAKIVADRFHVIRLINHHFLKVWQEVDPVGRKNRGLLSLMRRHSHNLSGRQQARLSEYFRQLPAFQPIYEFKQRLVRLMLIKERTKRQCRHLIPFFLKYIDQLKTSLMEPLVTLGKTLDSWSEEVVRMWRFTKTNGITEGFHNKMEMISRRAFGFKNFENYRLRVRVLCG